MNLFENIPENLFSVFNSKNKTIYVESLFLIKKIFTQELMIEKKTLSKQLNDFLLKNYANFQEEENSDISFKKNKSLVNYVLRKFTETGWIEIEYGMETDFKEFIALPPYSIKIINALYEIYASETREYNSYMYSVYSNLKQANEDKKDFMFSALKNAFEKTKQLEDELKSLFHNIRRKHNKLSYLNNVNEVLKDHFDEYQKKVIKQVYLPMKTKDSLNRFKGNIITILTTWLRKDETLSKMQEQAFSSGNFKTLEDAKEDIISKIYFIVDKFYDLEDMLEKIDLKNKQYISATTEKMKFLLNKDTSSKAKMIQILEKLENNFDDEDLHSKLHEKISLNKQGYYNETSLFVRSIPTVHFDSEPMEINFDVSDNIDEMAKNLVDKVGNIFSHKKVLSFMHEKMENKNELNIKELNIKSDNDLIFTIYSTIKGWDKNVFYKIELKDGKVINNNYTVPELKFIRRRKI